MNENRGEQSQYKIDREILEREGMATFDVGLIPEEKESIQEFKIEVQYKEFSYYGPANNGLREKLSDYLNALGHNKEEAVAIISNLVTRIAEDTQKEFNAEWAWVNVRASLPNDEFDVPRWHMDGRYFEHAPEEKFYKLVFAIKGSPTRFAKRIDPQKYDEIESRWTQDKDIEIREELASVVEEIEPISSGQAAMYLVGDKNAQIHSEPKIDEPRIFMQVLVGSEKQINDWRYNS